MKCINKFEKTSLVHPIRQYFPFLHPFLYSFSFTFFPFSRLVKERLTVRHRTRHKLPNNIALYNTQRDRAEREVSSSRCGEHFEILSRGASLRVARINLSMKTTTSGIARNEMIAL